MPKQLEINIYQGQRGGRRPNSGRTRIHSRGVSHSKRTPMHINFKLQSHLRTDRFIEVSKLALENAEKHGLNVVCYSIQSNHVHLIAEAKGNKELYGGMRSITNTIVKKLKKGSIQNERYHLHVLRNPTETTHALNYVLYNDVKHTGRVDKRFTKFRRDGKSWILTSSLRDIAFEA